MDVASTPFVQERQGLSLGFNMFMTKVFGMMSLGLFVSFSIAFVLMIIADANVGFQSTLALLVVPVILLQLVMVLVLSFLAPRLNVALAGLLFLFYAGLTGVTLGVIMMGYSLVGIISALGATFLTFGAMALFGYVTKADLSRIGALAFMGLIGLIIATIFNIFMYFVNPAFADAFQWVLTYAGVVIFLLLTAWDVQKLKRMAEEANYVNLNRLVVVGALTLYLDFINLFIYMLRILASSRE